MWHVNLLYSRCLSSEKICLRGWLLCSPRTEAAKKTVALGESQGRDGVLTMCMMEEKGRILTVYDELRDYMKMETWQQLQNFLTNLTTLFLQVQSVV